jgi:hypothetical protein
VEACNCRLGATAWNGTGPHHLGRTAAVAKKSPVKLTA